MIRKTERSRCGTILQKTIMLNYWDLIKILRNRSFNTFIDRQNRSYKRPESPSKQLITFQVKDYYISIISITLIHVNREDKGVGE